MTLTSTHAFRPTHDPIQSNPETGPVVGKGTWGSVCLGTVKRSGRKVAIKEIHRSLERYEVGRWVGVCVCGCNVDRARRRACVRWVGGSVCVCVCVCMCKGGGVNGHCARRRACMRWVGGSVCVCVWL